jgi:hypothetical protein
MEIAIRARAGQGTKIAPRQAPIPLASIIALEVTA